MAQLGLFLTPDAAALACIDLTSVEFHHDPGPFEGRSSDWATAPQQKSKLLKIVTFSCQVGKVVVLRLKGVASTHWKADKIEMFYLDHILIICWVRILWYFVFFKDCSGLKRVIWFWLEIIKTSQPLHPTLIPEQIASSIFSDRIQKYSSGILWAKKLALLIMLKGSSLG